MSCLRPAILRRATTCGAVRGDEHLASPSPGLRLAAGDLLYLVGPREAVERARARLRQGP